LGRPGAVRVVKIAIVGGGWSGLAAAVTATRAGHNAIVFEAAHAIGGRARAVSGMLPDGTLLVLDNGQHILIGAYTQTLRLMALVGVDPAKSLLRLPLTLQFPDGDGLVLPRWPSPLDALGGIWNARGWTWSDKWSLLRSAAGWQVAGFTCAANVSVADLCRTLTPRVLSSLIDPLCVSALNTPCDRASGQVFLRVLRDALLGGSGSSNLLLPTVDLSALFPDAAVRWLSNQGAEVRLGQRVNTLERSVAANGLAATPAVWRVDGESFDAVVWATSASNAAIALMKQAQTAPYSIAESIRSWAAIASTLAHEAIATVYTYSPGLRLNQPMVSLRSDSAHPAQFVFDRGQLGGPPGLLAFVVSASNGDRDALQHRVLQQAHQQLVADLKGQTLTPIQTIVEKRATFSCGPGLERPPQCITAGLIACGDYVQGPYPATLEGAVRSGVAAVSLLTRE